MPSFKINRKSNNSQAKTWLVRLVRKGKPDYEADALTLRQAFKLAHRLRKLGGEVYIRTHFS